MRPVQKPKLASSIAAAKNSRFLAAEAVRNDKVFHWRKVQIGFSRVNKKGMSFRTGPKAR